MEKKYLHYKHLGDAIVDFVEKWDAVLDEKLNADYKNIHVEPKEEKKEEKMENKVEEGSEKKEDTATLVSPAYDYINEWLSVDDNGNLAPHFAKRFPEGKKPRKRTNMYPIAADIVDYLCEYMPGNYKEELSLEHSVNRVLPGMVRKGRIEKDEKDGTYHPVTIEYKRKTMIEELSLHAAIDERQFFSVSSSTYIVFYKNNSLTNEINFFKKYVGEKSLVDVFAIDNKIVILIKGERAEMHKIGRSIRSAVEKAYVIQEEKRKKMSRNYRI